MNLYRLFKPQTMAVIGVSLTNDSHPANVIFMLKSIKAHPLLEGYRGSEPINIEALKKMLLAFSDTVMELDGEVDSIDLNPVICNASGCVVADARMMLSK
jgi:hypothetical protein